MYYCHNQKGISRSPLLAPSSSLSLLLPVSLVFIQLCKLQDAFAEDKLLNFYLLHFKLRFRFLLTGMSGHYYHHRLPPPSPGGRN